MQRGFTIIFRWVLPVPGAWDTVVTPLERKDTTSAAHPSAFTEQTGTTQYPHFPKNPRNLPKTTGKLAGMRDSN